MSATCKTCRFFEPITWDGGTKTNGHGYCRRFPPLNRDPWAFSEKGWCGEHQSHPRETLADAIEAGAERLVPRYEAAALGEGQAYIDGGRVQLTPAEVAIIRERMGRAK